MIDAYSEGQTLYADDFADDWCFPSAKWLYCTIDKIYDDIVTVTYHGYNDEEETYDWTREQMEELLGWDVGGSDSDSAKDDSAETSWQGEDDEGEMEEEDSDFGFGEVEDV